MVSEKEFLEEAAKHFRACPLCGSSEGFKVKGRFVKVMECNGCKSQWTAVTMLNSYRYKDRFTDEGEHYLRIFYWTKKGELGKYFKNKPLPVEFWTDPDKCRKYLFYAQELLKAFEKLRKAPSEVCRIKIEDETTIKVYGPSGDLVAVIMPSVEGLDISIAIADFSTTLQGNDKKNHQNMAFYAVLRTLFNRLKKRFEEHGEEFPVMLYRSWKGKLEKVEKNTFYPPASGQVVIPDKIWEGLLRCGVIKQTGPREYEVSFWDEER